MNAAVLVMAGQDWAPPSRQVTARLGATRLGSGKAGRVGAPRGESSRVESRLGMSGRGKAPLISRHGLAVHGPACHGLAGRGTPWTWQGSTPHHQARQGGAGPGVAEHGQARLPSPRPGTAIRDQACLGSALLGTARLPHPLTRLGMARLGDTCQDAARPYLAARRQAWHGKAPHFIDVLSEPGSDPLPIVASPAGLAEDARERANQRNGGITARRFAETPTPDAPGWESAQASSDSRAFFLERAETGGAEECWPWLRSRTPEGYGIALHSSVVTGGSRRPNILAHRVAYRAFIGPSPTDTSCITHAGTEAV